MVEAIGEGRRASYAIDYWLRGHDLDDPQVRRIVSEPQPNFLTIVPFTDDVKEPKAVMGKLGAEERKTNFDEYEFGYTHDQAMGEAARCLQCTCEAIGHCDLREAAIEYETTLNMAIDERSIQDNPYVGVNHGYGRDETHSFILRDYSPLHRLRALRPGLQGHRRAPAATTSSARASTRWSPPPTSSA